jgi:hypothetical protein
MEMTNEPEKLWCEDCREWVVPKELDIGALETALKRKKYKRDISIRCPKCFSPFLLKKSEDK